MFSSGNLAHLNLEWFFPISSHSLCLWLHYSAGWGKTTTKPRYYQTQTTEPNHVFTSLRLIKRLSFSVVFLTSHPIGAVISFIKLSCAIFASLNVNSWSSGFWKCFRSGEISRSGYLNPKNTQLASKQLSSAWSVQVRRIWISLARSLWLIQSVIAANNQIVNIYSLFTRGS